MEKMEKIHRVNEKVIPEGKPRLLKFKVESQESKKKILKQVREEALITTEYHELKFSSDYTYHERQLRRDAFAKHKEMDVWDKLKHRVIGTNLVKQPKEACKHVEMMREFDEKKKKYGITDEMIVNYQNVNN